MDVFKGSLRRSQLLASVVVWAAVGPVAACDPTPESPSEAPAPAPVVPDPPPPEPPPPWFSGRWRGEARGTQCAVDISPEGAVVGGHLRPEGSQDSLSAAGHFDQESSELRLRFQSRHDAGFAVLRREGSTLRGRARWSLRDRELEPVESELSLQRENAE